MSLASGSRFGSYEVLTALGAGGMGEVYRARDTKLQREVAIKVLPQVLAGDADYMARFQREAQVLASLNHPNIAQIYGLEDNAIVMELVGGRTLADRIAEGPMPLDEALPIASQIAAALEVAHEKGIVHRDLKPSNVMITDRGLVKVLDFGIAKVSAGPDAEPESHPTATLTHPGTVWGSTNYMSPEQALGQQVDSRSDIFAFGCVLYELVTGKRAFRGEGTIGTLAAIIATKPRHALELVPGLPKPVDRLIDICLKKKPVDRWQNMGDVKILLDASLEDLASGSASSSRPRRRKLLWPALALAAIAGSLLTAAVLYLRLQTSPVTAPALVLRRVTSTPGLSAFPALSRDGNLLAFASDRSEEGNLDIWLQQIGARDPIRLTRDPADESDPAISPDGTRIVFRSERGGPAGQGGLYVVPALGGDPVLLAPRGRNPRFSPDGRWIAYWEGRESSDFYPGSAKVFVIDAGGGQPRPIAAEMSAALYPKWSPKGDQLLVLAQPGANRADRDWWIVPFEQGSARKTGALPRIESQGLRRADLDGFIIPLEWRADGSGGVVFAATSDSAAGSGDSGNLWQIALGPGGAASGAAKAVTHGPGAQTHASAAAASDRDRLAFADLAWKPDVWAIPVDAERGVVSGERSRVTGDEPYVLSPSISADGSNLVFISRRLGRWALRTKDLVTGKEFNLLNSTQGLYNPRISGDGTTVAYSDRGSNILWVPRAGGSVEKLCEHCGTTMGISFDGKRISYEPTRKEDLTIYDVNSRKSVILAPQTPGIVLTGGQFSSDGNWIAFHSVGQSASTARIWIARIDGRLPVPQSEWIPITDGNSMEMTPAWSPSGSLLYFLSERDGFRCIRAVKLHPATRKPVGKDFAVQHFHTARWSLKRINSTTGMNGLCVVPGRIIVAFGELTGDIWLEEKP